VEVVLANLALQAAPQPEPGSLDGSQLESQVDCVETQLDEQEDHPPKDLVSFCFSSDRC